MDGGPLGSSIVPSPGCGRGGADGRAFGLNRSSKQMLQLANVSIASYLEKNQHIFNLKLAQKTNGFVRYDITDP